MFTVLATSDPLEHVLPHRLFHIGNFWINNHMLMAGVAGVLMLLTFPVLFRRPHPEAPTGARNLFESILEFLRAEVFRPALKEQTDRFAPFLWTVFFFILYCNLLGIIPLADLIALCTGKRLEHFGGSATANVNTTAALAICAFCVIHSGGLITLYRHLRDGTYGKHDHETHPSAGKLDHEIPEDEWHMRGEALAGTDAAGDFRAMGNPTPHYHDQEQGHSSQHGPGAVSPLGRTHESEAAGASVAGALLLTLPLYLWNFAPHPFKPAPGASKWGWFADVPMWGLLLLLEFIGAAIKPFALCVRLFANMVAGHIVLAVIVSLIIAVPSLIMRTAVGIPLGLLDLMIQFLEIFVAFLQAYIFMFLTTLFIASAVAPEH